MLTFQPGSTHIANVNLTVMPVGIECTAEVWLTRDGVQTAATSGLIAFTSTGARQQIQMPVVMPALPGEYLVYLDIASGGSLIDAFEASEHVTVPGQADIRVDAIVINPPHIVPNGAVNIQLQCTNYGGTDGQRTIPIYINGVHERDGIMTLAAGKSGAVNVAYTAFVEGTYEVTADNASASFVCSVPQPYKGTLLGTVKNNSGTGIASAWIRATNVNNGESWLMISDSTGAYTGDLTAGTYNVYAMAANYQDSPAQQVTITGGLTSTLNFTLVSLGVNKIKDLLAQTLAEGGYIYPNWQQLNFALGDVVVITMRFKKGAPYVRFGAMNLIMPNGQSVACLGGGMYSPGQEPGVYYSQWYTKDGANPTFLTVPGTYVVSFQLFSSEDKVNWAQTDSFNIVLGIVS